MDSESHSIPIKYQLTHPLELSDSADRQSPLRRAEELEEHRRKLSARLQEAEEQLESLNTKNIQLEKLKQRLSGELEDMHMEVDRAQQLANAMEKKARNFDKIIGEWKMEVRWGRQWMLLLFKMLRILGVLSNSTTFLKWF